MRKLLCGAAIAALFVSPALALQGQGKGQGGGNDGGNGGGKPDKAASAPDKARGGGGSQKPDKADRGAGRAAERQMAAADAGNQGNRGGGKPDKAARPDKPDNKPAKAAERAAERRVNQRQEVVRGSDGVIPVRNRDDDRFAVVERGRLEQGRGLIDGCPPGLAKKNNGCMPPGLAKQEPWLRPDWLELRGADTDNYRYYDGYMLRLGGDNQVLGYLPLLGGALSLGNAWPQAYRPVQVTPYYQDFFDLGPLDNYRYYDETIFRVDPQTSAITSIAALLTGDDIVVGQPMPTGYEVYNVPLDYRQQYVDGPNALHRYSDGYVYQLDPETRLVQAAIELLL